MKFVPETFPELVRQETVTAAVIPVITHDIVVSELSLTSLSTDSISEISKVKFR
jgi:hypothetical protein